MCFFVYAPNSIINLEYVNEHIKILPNGSSLIRTEIIIENCSNDPIEKLMLLYPNIFIKRWRDDEKYYDTPLSDTIKDLTVDFTKPNEKCNSHYNNVKKKSCSWNEETKEVSIIEPHPEEINKTKPSNLTHKGFVSTKNKIEVFENFKYEEIKVINGLIFTHITITCDPPIEHSKKHAFKIYFNPMKSTIESTSIGHNKSKKYFIKSIINRLRRKPLLYRIYSPYAIVAKFEESLLKHFPENIINSNIPEDVYKDIIASIKKKIFTDGIKSQNTETIITDWRTTINLADDVEILEISENCNIIKRISPFPEHYVSDNIIKMYQYYAGERYDKNYKDYLYSIQFSAKPTGFISQWKT